MNCFAATLHALRAAEPRVQIVDHHHVDAAVERALVGLHVGLDRRRGEQRAVGALDRNVDEREGGDRLRLPVLEHLEVFLLQVADDVALPVGDDDVDLDVVDADLEGRLLLRGGGAGGCWPAVSTAPDAQHEQRRDHSYTCIHT